MLQFGQAALTMSRSSDSSPAQSSLEGALLGSGLAAPFWFTIFRQPLAVVQAGRPYCER